MQWLLRSATLVVCFLRRGLSRLFEHGDRRRVSHGQVAKIGRILARLDEAAARAAMNLTGFGLHSLKGTLAGHCAVCSTGNWRNVLRFDGRDASALDLIDCHCEDRDMPIMNSPHPGLSVRHNCLEPLRLSISEAARKLGVGRRQLSEMVNCRSGMSAEMVIRFDKAFGGEADTWDRLQSAWDLPHTKKRAPRITVERLVSAP